eukprot:m.104830 g.104830  ORF g.104830 m.104830 type:complete len:314 (-) comp9116_c0_seq2:356-1297(-)
MWRWPRSCLQPTRFSLSSSLVCSGCPRTSWCLTRQTRRARSWRRPRRRTTKSIPRKHPWSPWSKSPRRQFVASLICFATRRAFCSRPSWTSCWRHSAPQSSRSSSSTPCSRLWALTHSRTLCAWPNTLSKSATARRMPIPAARLAHPSLYTPMRCRARSRSLRLTTDRSRDSTASRKSLSAARTTVVTFGLICSRLCPRTMTAFGMRFSAAWKSTRRCLRSVRARSSRWTISNFRTASCVCSCSNTLALRSVQEKCVLRGLRQQHPQTLIPLCTLCTLRRPPKLSYCPHHRTLHPWPPNRHPRRRVRGASGWT